MIQAMARENSETYKTNVLVLLESIRAAVLAYGTGAITEKDIPAPPENNKKDFRYAPSFMKRGASVGATLAHPYSAVTIGKFLGLNQPSGEASQRLRTALDALELVEEKYLRESELKNKTITELEKIVRERQWNRDRDLEAQAEAEAEREQREANAEADRPAVCNHDLPPYGAHPRRGLNGT